MTNTPRFISLVGSILVIGLAATTACSDAPATGGSSKGGSSATGGGAGTGTTGGAAGSGTTGGAGGSGTTGGAAGTGTTGGAAGTGTTGGSGGASGGASGGSAGSGGGGEICPGAPSESEVCGTVAIAGCMDDCGIHNMGMRTCTCVPNAMWDCTDCAITSGPFTTAPGTEVCCAIMTDSAQEDATDCMAGNDGTSCVSYEDAGERICACSGGAWDCASRPNEWSELPTITCTP